MRAKNDRLSGIEYEVEGDKISHVVANTRYVLINAGFKSLPDQGYTCIMKIIKLATVEILFCFYSEFCVFLNKTI